MKDDFHNPEAYGWREECLCPVRACIIINRQQDHRRPASFFKTEIRAHHMAGRGN